MFHSGYLMRMQKQISVIKERLCGHGVIRIIIIPRPVTILFYEGDGSGLNGFRWMVLPRWKMI